MNKYAVFKCCLAAVLLLAATTDGYARQPSVQEQRSRAHAQLVSILSKEFGKEKIDSIFGDPRLVLNENILKKNKTGTSLDYFDKEFGLLSEESLEAGAAYYKLHADTLRVASEKYGVEPEAIIAILRVETYFGKYTGKYSVLNSLYSWYVLSPKKKRKAWALQEIRFFLKLAERQGWDVYGVQGSYAGAFGLCQFLPSSYERFAVDGNGDGVVDLFNDADAIHSVANYLKKNGWGKTQRSKKQAVYRYNHSNRYVQAIFAYAKAIAKHQDKK